ncbi:MAG: 3-hydroxyisobutyrate dehydrogenase-like beta-hydroxyacid dehydrogenase [Candidatus Aldehydirespiratoraceae bacterium]|jgi:3-hydroxyisobutyrate dehydrogenase-like beta-hydroxyacid dehydrogenase
MSATVGYIGLGAMGGAMAGRLAENGFDLQVFDLNPDAIAAAVAKGATAATSGAELAAACEHISICVPDDAAVMEVVSGENGILDSCAAGTTIAVHSTVHPDTVRDLAALADEKDVALFDAGVAGGAAAAEVGDLSIMAGIPEGGLTETARSVLDCCGGAVFEAGPVGTGMAMKVAFNVMTYFQQAALSAANQIVVGEGSDPEQLLAAWRHVGQLGALTERFYPLVTMAPETKVGDLGEFLAGNIYLAEKDLDLAASLGRETGRPMPVVETVRDAMNLIYGMPTSEGEN